jgi:catechol 2,3-dioxygenase-like lactoylglutathione lyase family enzyme
MGVVLSAFFPQYNIKCEVHLMALPDMVGYVVKDMAATLAFYRLLGLAIPEGVEGESYVEVITPNGYRLSWNTEEMIKSIYPHWQGGTGRVSVAYKCASPTEVDALYASVTAAGHPTEREPFDAFWGQRYAVVQDPDGNSVDLFAPLE